MNDDKDEIIYRLAEEMAKRSSAYDPVIDYEDTGLKHARTVENVLVEQAQALQGEDKREAFESLKKLAKLPYESLGLNPEDFMKWSWEY